ncbi:unnamed protein product [Rangifer tarandus platyrhynchus]|uniref:Uncharacterized protein n=1 Tax=Rangifer tarandus platyrhynchus TaxID=3082113 RepID=A0ABN9A6F3_RANTA|nr:unnamed protein product [Rangifer tarandus platyrhynchus]
MQWYEVEDVPCGVPCWEKGTAVSVWTVAHPHLRSLPGLCPSLPRLRFCNPDASERTPPPGQWGPIELAEAANRGPRGRSRVTWLAGGVVPAVAWHAAGLETARGGIRWVSSAGGGV